MNRGAKSTALRSDGQEARSRLLDAALQLFGEKGYAKTSTREVALLAQVNVASISYYFGDKAGLYRAVFKDPRSNPTPADALSAHPDIDLQGALRIVLMRFTEPLKQGDMVQSCMRLHFREMLEPTGLWRDEIENNIRPAHQALLKVICRHLGLSRADDAIHRLTFSIVGLGISLLMGHDVISAVSPRLIATPKAIDAYLDTLQRYALAMIDSEAARRTT